MSTLERLFLAVPPEPETLNALLETQRCWEKALKNTHHRSVPAEMLHLTLHFLGDTPAQKREVLLAQLRHLSLPPISQEEFREAVLFPQAQRATVAALGVPSPAETTLMLFQMLQEALLRLQFSLEKRSFRPHVTLLRFPRPEKIHSHPLVTHPVVYPLRRVALYRSGRSYYEILEEFPLAPLPRAC